jgi:dCTP deaminase
MGNVYYDLTEGAKRFQLREGEAVLIKPGHRVVLITIEELSVPADILVRVISPLYAGVRGGAIVGQ